LHRQVCWLPDHCPPIVLTQLCGLFDCVSVKLHLRHKQTNKQADGQTQGIEFGLKTWHLVEIYIFLIISLLNFVYLLVNSRIFYPHLKFIWSIALRSPCRKRKTGKRTWSVCLFDAVWHKLPWSYSTTWSEPCSWNNVLFGLQSLIDWRMKNTFE